MPTLRTTTRDRNRMKTQSSAALIAAGALIAIAVSIVLVSLPSGHRAPTPATTSAYSSAIPAPILAPLSTSAFSDPSTRTPVHVRTPRCDAAKLRKLRVEKPCYSAP
jgi:hypothetical protein